MEFFAEIADWSLLTFALVLFVVEVAGYAAGYWLGQRWRIKRGTEVESIGLMASGILGLLTFVLALTLSYSNARFMERRHAALEEANAIGTAWLRAHALDDVRSREIAKLLEDYTRQRQLFVQGHRRSTDLEEINNSTSRLQTEIWTRMAAISHERTDPVVVALMQALNETFDMSTAQRFAFEARYPPQMFWLLIGLALISISALGYQFGLKGQKTYVLVGTLIAVWTAVIVVILDISAPRVGSIRTGAAVYDWTLENFKGGPRIP
ncbi:hypothetical protein [Hyphomicrobium sp.]|uniref:bestrophin-like domain n=1 Tax=Hyphomicrobium sp. TaxID=82 RepID=UPI002E2FD971|nr:hypothetical protein [Hyphomicrobium sp.]HEX2840523.1 hypothetical protein [Hyphomicrobium sp.]